MSMPMKSAAKRWTRKWPPGSHSNVVPGGDVVDVRVERAALHLPGADESVELAERGIGTRDLRPSSAGWVVPSMIRNWTSVFLLLRLCEVDVPWNAPMPSDSSVQPG